MYTVALVQSIGVGGFSFSQVTDGAPHTHNNQKKKKRKELAPIDVFSTRDISWLRVLFMVVGSCRVVLYINREWTKYASDGLMCTSMMRAKRRSRSRRVLHNRRHDKRGNEHSLTHPPDRQMCNLIHTPLSPKRIKNKKKELWCVVLSWWIQIENIFFYQSHIRVDVGSFVYSLDRATGGVAHHRATLLHEYSCTFFF